MYHEKNEAIGIVSRHSNSHKIFPYAIHLALHQSDFTCKCPVKSLMDQYKLVSGEVKKTTEFTKQ